MYYALSAYSTVINLRRGTSINLSEYSSTFSYDTFAAIKLALKTFAGLLKVNHVLMYGIFVNGKSEISL